MSDADVLIPDAHAELAISRLVQTGWKAKLTPLEGIQSPRQLAARGITPRPRDARQFTRVFLNVRHGHSFEKSDIAELDLHWRLFDRVVQPAADAEIWRRAVPLKLADIPTLCMDPTDQLLHVIAHGVRWNVVSPLRWVADAAMILGNSEVTIDWNRLVKDAQSQSLALPLAAGLNYLRRLLGIPIPAACLPQLRKWPGTLTQRIQHHLKLRPAGLWAGLDELVYLSRRYLQLVGRSEYPEADRGPLFFLQHVLGIDDPWQLGQYLLFEVARRSREQLTRTLPAYFLK